MTTANGTTPGESRVNGAAVAADWAEIVDYVATIWAQRMAETVTEAARWRAVATAAQRQLTELAARIEALEARRTPEDVDAAAAG